MVTSCGSRRGGPPNPAPLLFWVKKNVVGRKADRGCKRKLPPPFPLLSSRCESTTGQVSMKRPGSSFTERTSFRAVHVNYAKMMPSILKFPYNLYF